jgi:hypothetical protein
MKSRDEQDMLPFAGAPTKEAEERSATWTWRARIAAMLDLIAFRSRPCRACGEKIWLVNLPSGEVGVFNDDARSHFATCPQANSLRKGNT